MNHITMTCPVCKVVSKTVGSPNEADNGETGEWICFSCRSHGTYAVTFTVSEDKS